MRTSLALKSDGTVWAWGSNHDGQLGDGTFEPRAVVPRCAHSFALKNGGTGGDGRDPA